MESRMAIESIESANNSVLDRAARANRGGGVLV